MADSVPAEDSPENDTFGAVDPGVFESRKRPSPEDVEQPTKSARQMPPSVPTTCTHVRVSPDHAPVPVSYQDLPLPNPAKTYAFQLDVFQRESVMCLESQENVLVAAHTSAGKTAVAEYVLFIFPLLNNSEVSL